MTKVDYPEEIRLLIAQLKRLPGIGPRSAERIALWLLRSSQSPSTDLARALTAASAGILLCPSCGFFASTVHGCRICGNPTRDAALLCVIEQATDILPLERTGAFKGHYHALHGRLSPLDNIGPEDLRIPPLLQRLREGTIQFRTNDADEPIIRINTRGKVFEVATEVLRPFDSFPIRVPSGTYGMSFTQAVKIEIEPPSGRVSFGTAYVIRTTDLNGRVLSVLSFDSSLQRLNVTVPAGSVIEDWTDSISITRRNTGVSTRDSDAVFADSGLLAASLTNA